MLNSSVSLFLLQIPVICHRHFVVGSMRRRAGERGGWKERNIQTEGNVGWRGEGEWRMNEPTWVASRFAFFLTDWQDHHYWKVSDIMQRMQSEITNWLQAVRTKAGSKLLPSSRAFTQAGYFCLSGCRFWIHILVHGDVCLLCRLPAVCV